MPMTAYSEAQYAEIYPAGVENHFWQLARNRMIAATLRDALPAIGRVLEIGCGPAIVLRYLRTAGFDAWGCELGDPPLPEEMRPFVFSRLNCLELDTGFRDRIDALLLFDVLEHIEDDVRFLRNLAEAFPNARALIITVPGRAELWSNYDESFGHFRRYDRPRLAAVLEQGGFRPRWQRYFFQELYIPLLLIMKLRGQRATEFPRPEHQGFHRFLARICALCSTVLPPGLPGTSLIAVAVPKRANSAKEAA